MLVKEVQRVIPDRLGIPACQQSLIYSGSQMDPVRELCEHHVLEEATMHLVLRLLGC